MLCDIARIERYNIVYVNGSISSILRIFARTNREVLYYLNTLLAYNIRSYIDKLTIVLEYSCLANLFRYS